MKHVTRIVLSLLAVGVFATSLANAQGVTTGQLVGKILDEKQQPVNGASVIAIHLPSGTTYETSSRSDGRFFILNMRVGGPYSVTVAYTGTGTAAFAPETQENIEINLGVATDVAFAVKPISVTETITVTAQSDVVFNSGRTGAATSVDRETIATLPTISGRIGDLTRLTPQSSGMSFGGQDNRMNNITVNGAYFNNSFGLGGQPGDRTGVAPISLEAVEQIQVSIAPFDVRQGNFVGAAVNTITRSGTNQVRGSLYHRFRNENFVGTDAHGLVFNPGTFNTKQTGGWGGTPIVKNRLFLFGNYEDESDVRPLNSFRANNGGEPVAGNVTRVLASDLTTLSAFMKQNFDYDTGPFAPSDDTTPQKRTMLRTDLNLNNSNKFSFGYIQLNSSSDNNLSGSTSAGIGRNTFTSNFVNFAASNYKILENIKSGIGEWNSILGSTMSNSFTMGFTSNDESRPQDFKLFPFIDILDGNGVAYTSVGAEPFTPNNELRYKTLQFKNDFVKFGSKHSLTFGGALQRYRSENVFFNCCKQGAYVFNSLTDFYTEMAAALANPNRTTAAVTMRNYQVRYMNIPSLDKPIQPLQVWYGGVYAQDEWRPKTNLTVTAGLRIDTPFFKNTAYRNAKADVLTFRQEDGSPISYDTGAMPGANILWSPRLGFNYDLNSDGKTQIRGGTGVFTGQPLYVWISNQLGNTGVLQGSTSTPNTTAFPFSTNVDRYKPTNVTGEGAASYELNVTDNDFKFPQVWRNNLAVDRRLPGGITGTAEFLYNRDLNGIYYINANLPAAQTAFVGADTRPRWVGTACGTGTAGPCVNRINNVANNQVTSAIVMKNQNVGRNWNLSFSASKPSFHGLSLRTAYSYGRARNTIDPGSTAFASWSSNPTPGDPNNPGIGFSTASPGHRVFVQTSYTRQYFGFGATSIAMFWEARTINNTSYIFASDANGDGANGDLIYIPRDKSEMNFVDGVTGGITFTAAQQADAFEAYIQQDKYLSAHRGEYAERGGVFLPLVKRMDLSLTQDVFKNIKGKRNAGQFRIDITNFGNMLNSNWGVGQRLTRNNILMNPGVDAQGRLNYRLQVVNNQLLTKSLETTSGLGDVYQFMLSFRYTFN
jgi:predicted DNA-binding ribbon-helix-helix protein